MQQRFQDYAVHPSNWQLFAFLPFPYNPFNLSLLPAQLALDATLRRWLSMLTTWAWGLISPLWIHRSSSGPMVAWRMSVMLNASSSAWGCLTTVFSGFPPSWWRAVRSMWSASMSLLSSASWGWRRLTRPSDWYMQSAGEFWGVHVTSQYCVHVWKNPMDLKTYVHYQYPNKVGSRAQYESGIKTF